MHRSKRSRAALVRSLSLAAILAVGTALVGGSPARAADQTPIKIGFISSLSGYLAAPGKYMEEGLKLYLQEHDYTIAGRKVVLDIADDQGNPSVGLTQLRRLVEQDHVNVIFGPLSAAVGSAMAPYLDSHKIPAVYPIVSSDDLTQRTPATYVVRTGWTSSQTTQPLGDYAYKTLKYRKVATIGYDFSFGWESIGGFVATFQDDGGKVVKQIWTPLSTTDFSPYLSEIPRDADAVMCSFSGSLAINFMKQYKAFGLKAPLLCQGNATDESTLQATGPAALGVVTALQYSAALDTPANKKFVAAYTKAYGHGPSYYGEGTYVGAMVLAGGINALHGNISDAAAFVKAMRGVDLANAPRGPIHFDSYGNPVENVYIRKVEEVDGQLANVVIQTDHNVSQFWTYNPATFLQHPVYSRSYPPCNDCK
ncbi:MAG TPA: ABC transporter substrate-binding protein [Candidatus Dormibacteraeota bacterium]|nr:ABC transporter substrate-binding protein [Candidatus Dormibacteraeota bacterium]